MAGDRADARNWVRVLQTLEEEVPALRTRQPAVVAVEAAAGADASADKKMNVGATHRQLPDLDEPMCALPSYGSSDDSENNDNAVVGRGREYSSEESEGDAIAGTFGHLRLSEAMRKSSLQQHRRRSGDAASSLNKETLASSLVAKETLAQCHGIGHVDIQGDKVLNQDSTALPCAHNALSHAFTLTDRLPLQKG